MTRAISLFRVTDTASCSTATHVPTPSLLICRHTKVSKFVKSSVDGNWRPRLCIISNRDERRLWDRCPWRVFTTRSGKVKLSLTRDGRLQCRRSRSSLSMGISLIWYQRNYSAGCQAKLYLKTWDLRSEYSGPGSGRGFGEAICAERKKERKNFFIYLCDDACAKLRRGLLGLGFLYATRISDLRLIYFQRGSRAKNFEDEETVSLTEFWALYIGIQLLLVSRYTDLWIIFQVNEGRHFWNSNVPTSPFV